MRFLISDVLRNFCLFGSIVLCQVTDAKDVPDDHSKASGFLTTGQLQQKKFSPLFTGKDLSSWRVEQGHRGHWMVRDGNINYDGKATQKKHLDRSLWTKKSYQDIEFYIEWRFPDEPVTKQHPIVLWNGDFLRDEAGKRITRPHWDAGDSGILFRGVLDCQANIWCQEMGSGEINGFRTDKSLSQIVRRSCIPVEFGDNPLGEWNAFLITIQDNRMKVELNGKLVLFSEPLPGLPESGPVGLQHHGDHVQFRNIWIKELQRDE